MPFIVTDAGNQLSPRMPTLLDQLWVEWRQLDHYIETASDDIERIAKEDEDCRGLRQIPGVGPLAATATVACQQSAILTLELESQGRYSLVGV